MRRWLLALWPGALIGAAVVLAVQATSSYRDWSCSDGPHASCIKPAFWSWSALRPGWIVVGGFVGAAVTLALAGLAERTKHRRREWGEE